MKRGTPDHFKVHDLARRLSLPRYAAIGLLESLWHVTAKHAPAGDIGRLPDDQIAFYIGWDREPSRLIDSLVDARWLDRHAEHRLIVHDWWDHCDNAVHQVMARSKQFFANGTSPKTSPLPLEDRKAADAFYRTRASFEEPIEPAGSIRVPASSRRAPVGNTAAADGSLPLPKPMPLPEPLPKPKTQRPIALAEPPPDPLNTPAFHSAWKDYEAHRLEMKQKPLSDRSRTAKWIEMAAWGHDAAIQSIRNTIANGWRGLFEPSLKFNAKEGKPHDADRHRAAKRAVEYQQSPIVVPRLT